MSSKIDGIQHELLERIAGDSYQDSLRAVGELRELLAAPVVERQPAYWEYRGTSMGDQVEKKQMDCLWLNPNATHEHDYIKGVPLYREPPELAELQATIARFRREQGNDLIAYRAAIEKQDELRIENERLKSESFESLYNDAVDEIERLKGGQGEPVLWVSHHLMGSLAGKHFIVDGPESVPNRRLYAEPKALYTSQPAPVSVLTEVRALLATTNYSASRDCHNAQVVGAACDLIDKAKELNQ